MIGNDKKNIDLDLHFQFKIITFNFIFINKIIQI